LHEITHGLGFISLLPNRVSTYDSLIEGDINDLTSELSIGGVTLHTPDPIRRGTSVSHLAGGEGECKSKFNVFSNAANTWSTGSKIE